jgi:hypothetical protein
VSDNALFFWLLVLFAGIMFAAVWLLWMMASGVGNGVLALLNTPIGQIAGYGLCGIIGFAIGRWTK